MLGARRAYTRHLMRGASLLLGVTALSVAFGESFLRLCPASMLPAHLQEWRAATPDEVGVSHAALGALEPPYQTGVFTGRDFHATYHTDGYGFRNPWPWPEAAEIVVLGDAVVFGYGVEDAQAWPALLAQWLAPQRVLNLALMDAGPQQYLRAYETFGRTLHPRVILVGLSLINDFEDAELFERWLQAGSKEPYSLWKPFGRAQTSRQRPFDPVHTFLSRHSYLYHMWWPNAAPVTHFRCLDGVWLRLLPGQLEAARGQARPNQPAFRLVLQALERLHTLVQEQGTDVICVFQPSKEETYLPLRGDAESDLQQTLQDALAQRGIASLDLTPVFRHHAALGSRLFFAVDSYPNAQGHTLIARNVLRHLTGQALTDSVHPWELGDEQGGREHE